MYQADREASEPRSKVFIIATEQPFKGLSYSARYTVPGWMMRWEAKHYLRRQGVKIHRHYSYLIHMGWKGAA